MRDRGAARPDRRSCRRTCSASTAAGRAPPLGDEESAAVVAARIASLACGHSGVRPLVIDRLVDLLEKTILPRIPAEGSVGASGDLTPLSYVAAVLAGEREVSFAGEVMPAARALRALRPGAADAAAQGGAGADERHQHDDRARLPRFPSGRGSWPGWPPRCRRWRSELMRGNPSHFDERLFVVKPHPGSAACAALDPRRSRIRRRRRRGRGRARPGSLFDPLRAPRHRRAAGRAGDVPPDPRDRGQQRQRQPDHRRRARRDPARRELLRRPRRVRDGRAQGGGRQRRRPARSAAGAAVQPGDQPRPAREPGGAGRRRAASATTASRRCRSPPRR